MFRLDDMSVVEWLTTTRWELEMSADAGAGHELSTRAAHRCPRLGTESTACEELAWSLVQQAAWDLQLELYLPKLKLAA